MQIKYTTRTDAIFKQKNIKRPYFSSPSCLTLKTRTEIKVDTFLPQISVPSRLVVPNWFKVEQANSDARSEQHREIGRVSVLRFIVWFSKFDVGILGEVHNDYEHSPCVLGSDVQPGPSLCDPQHPGGHLLVGWLWLDNTPYDKAPNDNGWCYSNDGNGINYYRADVEFNARVLFRFVELYACATCNV